MNIRRREKLKERLKDKEYRDAFVSEHIDTGLPFQIKALREEREWSQEKLGNMAGMHQERISALEDPNYGKFTLRTLKKLASAFDVALMVVFVPFSKLLDWESDLSPEALRAVSFEEDNFSVTKEEEPTEIIDDKIDPSKAPPYYPSPILGLFPDPKRFGAVINAFKAEQKPQKSQLTEIVRNANETSLNTPRPIDLARTVN